METKEFRSLPDCTVIIRVVYNTKENPEKVDSG